MDWHNEEWAKNVARRDSAERMRRISAVTVLLDHPHEISDPLYSELVVLLDALKGTDLREA